MTEVKEIPQDMKLRQVRMPNDMFEKASKIFAEDGLSFSGGVRLMLEETIRSGKIPFRPDQKAANEMKKLETRKEEMEFLNNCLGLGKTDEQRLFDAIFGKQVKSSKDLDDDELREWGKKTGLPDTLSLTTLGELFDNGVFPKDLWDCGISANTRLKKQDGSELPKAEESSIFFQKTEANIRLGLQESGNNLLKGALKYLYEYDNEEEE